MGRPSDDAAIKKISEIATELTGVQLNESHREMIRSRLQRRMTELGLATLEGYLEHLQTNRAGESSVLIGLITTHHTFFFREFLHFEYLGKEVLPKLKEELLSRPDRTLHIWSAACSRGQEVYSLAMFLDHTLPKLDPSLKYRIHGTDVDPASIEIAKNGVYRHEELKSAPLSLVANHWARGTGKISDFVKVKKSLKSHCSFDTANLLAPASFKMKRKFDVIFCRNVFIYFNADQIKKITQSLMNSLSDTGSLFVGITESLSQLKLPLKALGPSVYTRKPEKIQPIASHKNKPQASDDLPPPLVARPIRVLCVDDSKTILTILKHILVSAQGFEVVGTAENGLEASRLVQELKPDIITLDIHMPVMNGIEFLEKNFKPGHPPVVMLTSVSREDQALAGRALNLGASDYIEKPALAAITQRKEEICWKLKCAFESAQQSSVKNLALDQQFQAPLRIEKPELCQRVILFSLADRKKVGRFIREAIHTRDIATVLVVPGSTEILDVVAAELTSEFGRPVEASRDWTKTGSPGRMILVDDVSLSQGLAQSKVDGFRTSIEVFGNLSAQMGAALSGWQNALLLLEDLGKGKGVANLMEIADDVAPYTSFDYLSGIFFSKDKATPHKPGQAA